MTNLPQTNQEVAGNATMHGHPLRMRRNHLESGRDEITAGKSEDR
jgi:hypothetical protein